MLCMHWKAHCLLLGGGDTPERRNWCSRVTSEGMPCVPVAWPSPLDESGKAAHINQLGLLPYLTSSSFTGAAMVARWHWWRICHTDENKLPRSTEQSGTLTFGESNQGALSVATIPSLDCTFVLNRSRKSLKLTLQWFGFFYIHFRKQEDIIKQNKTGVGVWEWLPTVSQPVVDP